MGKGKRKLAVALAHHTEALRTTFQLLDEPAAASLEKVLWVDVKTAAEQVSKHATMTGMLWCGVPTAQEASDKMDSYINDLQGFLLLCHGSTVGAGPTLLAAVRKFAEKVLETSLVLLNKTLEIETSAARKEALPPYTGMVWDACDSAKKTASDNRMAVGRGIVEVGMSMKDVLRELNEVEVGQDVVHEENEDDDDDDDMLDGDITFTQPEVEVARKIEKFVAGVVDVVRELLFIVGKAPDTETSREHLEALLKHIRDIGKNVEELGASTYPPQELDDLKNRSRNILSAMGLVSKEAEFLLVDTQILPESLAGQINRVKECYESLQQELVSEELAGLTLH